jgi:hypothetical protein
MNQKLSSFAARLRELIANRPSAIGHRQFSELALELFSLQYEHNSAYRKICDARKLTPEAIEHWTQIPAVPAAAFKELELTSLAPDERTAVFYSSGTTGQEPSRHFHSAESLAVYEVSLWAWFEQCVLADLPVTHHSSRCLFLTPPPNQSPHSSLVHMFETVRLKRGLSKSPFTGQVSADGSWTLDFGATIERLMAACGAREPLTLLGPAFSIVHLLDYLAANNVHFRLPQGSRVMETGGYKNRSRVLPKSGLHALISRQLGIPLHSVLCEYGMSELSSQAYDSVASGKWPVTSDGTKACHPPPVTRHFRFPPWARAQIVSPETGREVADGETGLIRIFDLANVFSVAGIQTEDLAVCRGDGFELIGRAQLAEPRGCSLMTA